jgi:hypothetical protein
VISLTFPLTTSVFGKKFGTTEFDAAMVLALVAQWQAAGDLVRVQVADR